MGYGDLISSLEDAFDIAATELQFLLYRSKSLFKKFLMELIKNNNLLKKTPPNHLFKLTSVFSSTNLEYQDKSKLITLPGIFEVETPFTYKSRKFGRQSVKSQITAISETRGYSFRFPINLRAKKGLYSGKFSHQYFNQNFYRVNPGSALESKEIYYHEW